MLLLQLIEMILSFSTKIANYKINKRLNWSKTERKKNEIVIKKYQKSRNISK